ncbi:MAG TPA: 2-hydroxychromene-2-carboxylate isomerase [Casimicrobiaceae bacterium]|nr:2-hydroxychromene-2-carboxylate isomerase [Casimicrobiaceae bacterium]
MPSAVDFYFDFSSPYGYLASEKIEALAAGHARSVDWHPMLLGVVFKETGARPLTQVPLKGDYSKRDMARSARLHGVAFRMPSVFPIATQAPARIVLWLKREQPALVAGAAHALFRAFFVDDVDISNPDHAASAVAKCGADPAAARAAIDDPAIKDALRQENEQAIGRGVFGSPFVIVDGEAFWGVDKLEQVERWLSTGGW